MEKMRNENKILGGKHKRKRPFGIFRRKRDGDMEIYLTQDVCGCGLESTATG
jgi:hypothetical protein